MKKKKKSDTELTLKDFTDASKKLKQPKEDHCPDCGRCPTCGEPKPTPMWIMYPPYPTYFPWNPIYPTYTTSGDGTTTDVTPDITFTT
jgi:hypothetical protein|tara:strand:- start:3766 stop:4029 length:264 start_codon:yes stop_codon:yes gene_type:complete